MDICTWAANTFYMLALQDFIARYCSKSITKAKREFGYSAADAAAWAIRVLTGKFGKTPRDYASSQGHTEVAARLLKAAGGGAKS